MEDPELRIFISYRRADAAVYAGGLAYGLEQRFGSDNVFRDVSDIEGGDVFSDVIANRVRNSDVVLCLIGKSWTTGGSTENRLMNENDPVRQELKEALTSPAKPKVIPVLLDDTEMPRPEMVPPDLTPLLGRNAVPLRDRSWRQDVERLAHKLETVAEERAAKKLRGQDILDRHQSSKRAPKWVGRNGGLLGSLFRNDVATGNWRTQAYEVSFSGQRPSRNWFSLGEFVRAVTTEHEP